MECLSAVGVVYIRIGTGKELVGVFVAILGFCIQYLLAVHVSGLICDLLGLLNVLRKDRVSLWMETRFFFVGSVGGAEEKFVLRSADSVAWSEVGVGEGFGCFVGRSAFEAVEL